jgi:hypothetical protein
MKIDKGTLRCLKGLFGGVERSEIAVEGPIFEEGCDALEEMLRRELGDGFEYEVKVKIAGTCTRLIFEWKLLCQHV